MTVPESWLLAADWNDTAPEEPSALPPLATFTMPLDPSTLLPAANATLPPSPEFPLPLPAWTRTSPVSAFTIMSEPSSVVDLPPNREISPPAVAAPECSKTSPVADTPVPDTTLKLPVTPLSVDPTFT